MSGLPKESRACRSRCPAGGDFGPSHLGALCLDVLGFGQHALADCGSLQLLSKFHLPIQFTPGGLIQMRYRLQKVPYGWYEDLQPIQTLEDTLKTNLETKT